MFIRLGFYMVLIACVISCVNGSSEGRAVKVMTLDGVREVVSKLSDQLLDLFAEESQYELLARRYDDSGYDRESLDARAAVDKLQVALTKFFDKKYKLVESAAERASQIYEEYLQTGDDNKSSVSGEPSATSQLNVSTEESGKGHGNRVRNLPISEFIDAEKLSEAKIKSHGEIKTYYNRQIGRDVLIGRSVVKLPHKLNTSSVEVVDAVRWSSRLDTVFSENLSHDNSIRWMYFASAEGPFRIYPGVSWDSAREDFDARRQHWYQDRWAGLRDIIIIIDTSASMNDERLTRAKRTAVHLISGFSHRHRVNVVASASHCFDGKGNEQHVKVRVLGCKSGLAPATPAQKGALVTAIEELHAAGASNHFPAFQSAFRLLTDSAREADMGMGLGGRRVERGVVNGDCRQAVIFITDGDTDDENVYCSKGMYVHSSDNSKDFVRGLKCLYDSDHLLRQISRLQGGLAEACGRTAHIFSYIVSKHGLSSTTVRNFPGRLACQNNGILSVVASDKEFAESRRDIYNEESPHWPLNNTVDYTKVLKHFYQFIQGTEPILNATLEGVQPSNIDRQHCFTIATGVRQQSSEQRLLGVVGANIQLSEVEDEFYAHVESGVHAFLMNIDDGTAVFHPSMARSFEAAATTVAAGGSVYSRVVDLETPDLHHYGVTRSQFTGVVESAMRSRRGGDRLLGNAKVAGLHYFYAAVPDSNLVAVVRVTAPDYTFLKARDLRRRSYRPNEVSSYLHTLLGLEPQDLELLPPQTESAVRELNITVDNFYFSHLPISLNHSVVVLSPRAFCNSSHFTDQYTLPYLIDIQAAITPSPSNYPALLSHSRVRREGEEGLEDDVMSWVTQPAEAGEGDSADKPAKSADAAEAGADEGVDSDKDSVLDVLPLSLPMVEPGLSVMYDGRGDVSSDEKRRLDDEKIDLKSLIRTQSSHDNHPVSGGQVLDNPGHAGPFTQPLSSSSRGRHDHLHDHPRFPPDTSSVSDTLSSPLFLPAQLIQEQPSSAALRSGEGLSTTETVPPTRESWRTRKPGRSKEGECIITRAAYRDIVITSVVERAWAAHAAAELQTSSDASLVMPSAESLPPDADPEDTTELLDGSRATPSPNGATASPSPGEKKRGGDVRGGGLKGRRVVLRYTVTDRGVTRVYPGIMLPHHQQSSPTQTGWYRDAIAAGEGIVSLTAPHRCRATPNPIATVITMATALAPNCIKDGSCPTETTDAVIALDIDLTYFINLVTSVSESATQKFGNVSGPACGSSYPCFASGSRSSSNCSTLCLLLSVRGDLLTSIPARHVTQLKVKSLFVDLPRLTETLLRHGIMYSRWEHVGEANKKSDLIKLNARELREHGGASAEVASYRFNLTHLRSVGGTFTRTLTPAVDSCHTGLVHVTLVEGTDSILVTIYDHTRLLPPDCFLSEVPSGPFTQPIWRTSPEKEPTCAPNIDISDNPADSNWTLSTLADSTCARTRYASPPCGFSYVGCAVRGEAVYWMCVLMTVLCVLL